MHHRRAHARLRLGVEARFLGLDGEQAVILQDLSKTGAKVLLEHAKPVSQGLLRWMHYEVFADVAWRKGQWCGLRFDEPVTDDCLHMTRAAAPALAQEPEKRLMRYAQGFVQGDDWRG